MITVLAYLNLVSKIIALISIVLMLALNIAIGNMLNDIRFSEPINASQLNSEYDDFAPQWSSSQNILYYNSNRSGNSKFYKSNKLVNKWSNPSEPEGSLNADNDNRSYISFEGDKSAYISMYKNYGKTPTINIFKCGFKRGVWLDPYPADSLGSEYFTAHATVSPDGNLLIYSSAKGTEYGDLDLFMAFRQDNGTWGGAIKLSSLNTPGNEITPYLMSNDTLLFASDGQDGPGGYDLFISIYTNDGWRKPFPLIDLNTQFNESDICSTPYGSMIFASDRPGSKGGLDLYEANVMKESQLITAPSIQKFDISISAQVASIRAKVRTETVTKQIVPYIILPNGYASLMEYDISGKFGILPLKASKYPFSKFIVTISIPNEVINESNVGEIRKRLCELIGISDERLVIESISSTPNFLNRAYVFIDTNLDDVMFPERKEDYSIQIEPPAIDIMADARPRESSKYADLAIMSGSNKRVIAEKQKLPISTNSLLEPLALQLADSDVLIVELTVYDKNDNILKDTLSLDVFHLKQSSEKLIEIGGKQFMRVELILADKEHLKRKSFSSIIRILEESAVTSKSITINYFDKNSEPIAQEILKIIANPLANKSVKLSKSPINTAYPSNMTYEILLEK